MTDDESRRALSGPPLAPGRTIDGSPLTPGVNVDPVSYDAGLAAAIDLGYGDPAARMVVTYALQRHARGEEDGAERTWLAEYPRDFTSWRVILAAAVAAGTQQLEESKP